MTYWQPWADKREPTVPIQGFDDWLHDQFAEQDADDVAALVDDGWTEDDARAFVSENPREGGEP